MSPLWIAALCVLVLLALPTARWIRAARWQWKHAKHVMRAAEQDVEAATVFYGSMNLDAERAWQRGCPVCQPGQCQGSGPGCWFHYQHEDGPDWLTATMAELSPEALDDFPGEARPDFKVGSLPGELDPGPGDHPPLAAPGPAERLCGPEQPQEARTTADVGVAPAMKTGIGTPGPAPDNEPEPYETDEEFIASVAHLLPLEALADEVIIVLDEPALERLADTGDIRDAALLADTTTYMRDQDADVKDWLAGRAITWARLEIGVLA